MGYAGFISSAVVIITPGPVSSNPGGAWPVPARTLVPPKRRAELWLGSGPPAKLRYGLGLLGFRAKFRL